MIRPMTCPICEKDLPAAIDGDSPLFPFCSECCKQVDLYRWFTGGYAVVEDLTPDQLVTRLIPDPDDPLSP